MTNTYAGLNKAQELLHSWLTPGEGVDVHKMGNPHRYKAPHAYRGTPPRPHFKRNKQAKVSNKNTSE